VRLFSSLDLEQGLHQVMACLRLAGFPLSQVVHGDFLPSHQALQITYQATVDEGRRVTRLVPLDAEARASLYTALLGLVPTLTPGQSPVGRQMARALARPAGSCITLVLPCAAASRALRSAPERGSPTPRAPGAPAVVAFFVDPQSSLTAAQLELLEQLRTPLTLALGNALSHRELRQQRDALADDLRFLRHPREAHLVGSEGGLRQTFERARQVAQLGGPVHIAAEVGAGRRTLARMIHLESPRRGGPLLEVDLGALEPDALDLELFGDELEGEPHRGRVERADGGSLYLAGVELLPRSTQARLLNLLRRGEIERVGAVRSTKVDVRLIVSTHHAPPAGLRDDLWHPLSLTPVEVPPLRRRLQDLPALVQHFVQARARSLGRDAPPLAADAPQRLAAYPWPGNVRELKQVVQCELARSPDGPLMFASLGMVVRGAPVATEPPLSEEEAQALSLDDAMARHIRRALGRCDGRINGAAGAAELLGIHPNTLRHRMRRLGVSFGRQGR